MGERKTEGNAPLGVFQPTDQAKAKKAFLELLEPTRTMGIYEPNYTPESSLGVLLRTADSQVMATVRLKAAQPYRT